MGIRQRLYVLVSVGLIFRHVVSETRQDSWVEALQLVVVLGVMCNCDQLFTVEAYSAGNKLGKELQSLFLSGHWS